MLLSRLADIFWGALYPNLCAGCNGVTDEGEFFCEYCFAMLYRCETDKFCLKCGSEKKYCLCKKQVFHFDGCVSPLYNTGVARHAMYKFKFRRKETISKFFSEQMALCVKQCFGDISFDGIVYVPTEKKTVRRRGYNQSEVLAKGISDILKIPVLHDTLYSKGKKYKQHKIKDIKQRYKNVKDVYFSGKNLFGKNLLLVDDIRTSGATLDACSKVLFAAGADRVYCITGLMSDYHRENKNKSVLKGKKNGN